MAEVPFPNGAKDGTVFFHEDKVCIFSESLNTWECRKVVDPDDPNRPTSAIYSNEVYIPAGLQTLWQLAIDRKGIDYTVPTIQNQQDINRAVVELVCRLEGGDTYVTDTSNGDVDLSNYATQQDVALSATAVDAKFDMLRVAISESTDFATLKARLLAVLN